MVKRGRKERPRQIEVQALEELENRMCHAGLRQSTQARERSCEKGRRRLKFQNLGDISAHGVLRIRRTPLAQVLVRRRLGACQNRLVNDDDRRRVRVGLD
jgi:hypothetical protein